MTNFSGTFSTFGLDTLKMIHDGAITTALIYVAISAILGVAMVALGYELAKG